MRQSILILSSFLLAACATTGPGGVSVETTFQGQPLTGASCIVQIGAANWNVVTPAMIDPGSVGGDVRVVCDKPGYRTSELIYRASSGGYPGSSFGIGIGGGSRHVGVGLGMSVPIALGGSGSPARITVEMNPQ